MTIIKVEQESHAFSINGVRLKRLNNKMRHIHCCRCKSTDHAAQHPFLAKYEGH